MSAINPEIGLVVDALSIEGKECGAEPAWVQAGKMRPGDLVQSIQGDWRRVTAITPVAAQETVYNFTVDLNHDYFVGESGLLVHNKNCGCFPDNPADMNDMLGFEGTPVPDGPTTPGRNKTIWKLAKGVVMRFEQHPYFGPSAPACETQPHWQIGVNGRNIGKWMPGDPIP